MTKATTAGRSTTALLAMLTLAGGCGSFGDDRDDAGSTSAGTTASAPAGMEAHPSFLYGRITTVDGDSYEGRIRFGGDEEAFWSEYFNGFKDGNPWVAQVPAGAVRGQGRAVRVFGFEIRFPGSGNAVRREFMARFGDIAKLEARGRELRVTLRTGTVVDLDRYSADDFADGVRVWDGRRGVVDLHEREVRSIEFLRSDGSGADAPYRLHGTVRTREGDFTGFLEWGREGSVALDQLDGHDAEGELVRLPFVTVRSIARLSPEGARVTLLDGSELVLSDSRDIGEGNRGVFVDDARYGRVLVSWNAFERVDLTPVGAAPGAGPAYDDFPMGGPLVGSVTTRTGRRLTGRLVYDLDESQIVETLDAPSRGVTYTLPFGLVASIRLDGDEAAAGRARVTLRSGEEMQLERSGDLGDRNAGILIFGDGDGRPAYVPWADVALIEFTGSPAVYPPVGGARLRGGLGQ
jgi:hypothetical protein